jgi:hypothetical protein
MLHNKQNPNNIFKPSGLPIGPEIQETGSGLINKAGQVYARSLETRMAISKGLKGKKKNYTCWLKGRTGPAHPSYKHGKGKNRDYDSRKYSAWIEGVLQKNNFKCVVTGETTNLACHHLEAWSISEAGQYNINNGVPLKKSIHTDFHGKYGASTTTAEFEDYLQTQHNWGDKPFPWRQGNHEPSLSVDQFEKKQLRLKEKKYKEFVALCASCNHEIISSDYVNAQSKVIIKCQKHNQIIETTFTNYKKCKNGLRCCGREVQAQKAFTNYYFREAQKREESLLI